MHISEKEVRNLLDKVGFEVSYDWLVQNVEEHKLVDLIDWIKKYQLNMKGCFSKKMEIYDSLMYPCDLDEDDPRYEDSCDYFLLSDDAPEDLQPVVEMINEFDKFSDCLPCIEFGGSSFTGEK